MTREAESRRRWRQTPAGRESERARKNAYKKSEAGRRANRRAVIVRQIARLANELLSIGHEIGHEPTSVTQSTPVSEKAPSPFMSAI